MFIRLKKAQSTAEYAIVVGMVIAAVIGVQAYIRSAYQQKAKEAVGYFLDQTQNIAGSTTVNITTYQDYQTSFLNRYDQMFETGNIQREIRNEYTERNIEEEF